MALLSSLIDRLRLELGDPPQGFQARVTSDGATTRYNLPVEYVRQANLKVYLASAPGSPLDEGTDFTMDYRNGAITLANAPAAGQDIIVEGTYTEAFLDSELTMFIETAFLQHTHGQKDRHLGLPLTMQDLPGVEEYLVVVLAQIEALWSMVTDAAQEIDVRSPDGVTIPVGQRYQQLLGLIAAKKAYYQELAQQLNVGLNRIEMFTLRRVSRTTNRLVPLYQTMEYDQINKGFVPDYGPEGTTVVIRGDKFTGTTSVRFWGGVEADFTVVNDEMITTTVPPGAQSGRITIVNPAGQTETHFPFKVGLDSPKVNMGAGAQRIRPPIDDGMV